MTLIFKVAVRAALHLSAVAESPLGLFRVRLISAGVVAVVTPAVLRPSPPEASMAGSCAACAATGPLNPLSGPPGHEVVLSGTPAPRAIEFTAGNSCAAPAGSGATWVARVIGTLLPSTTLAGTVKVALTVTSPGDGRPVAELSTEVSQV